MSSRIPSIVERLVNQNCYLVPTDTPLHRHLVEEAGWTTGKFYYIKLQHPVSPISQPAPTADDPVASTQYCASIAELLDNKPAIATLPALLLGIPAHCVGELETMLEERHPPAVLRTEEDFARVVALKTHAPDTPPPITAKPDPRLRYA